MSMNRRFTELTFVLALIALLANHKSVDKPVNLSGSNGLFSETLLQVPFRVETPRSLSKSSSASIMGVELGMKRRAAELALRERLGDRFQPRSGGDQVTEYGQGEGAVYVYYDKNEHVISVSGNQLEIDGATVLTGGYCPPEDVQALLGPPDSSGCAGVMMCEGPFGGYRYGDIQATISFSYLISNNYSLGPHGGWLEFENEDPVYDKVHF